MSKVKTEVLNERLIHSDNFKEFYTENKEAIRLDTFCNCLYDLLQAKGIKNSEFFANALMSESYGYYLLNGQRKPSRDKVIQAAIGLELSIEKTNLLLKLAGKSELYVKDKRDAIIIFSINKGFSIIDMNILLEEEQCEVFS